MGSGFALALNETGVDDTTTKNNKNNFNQQLKQLVSYLSLASNDFFNNIPLTNTVSGKETDTHCVVSKLSLISRIVLQIDKSIFFGNNCSHFLRMCIFCSTFGRRLVLGTIPPKVRSQNAAHTPVSLQLFSKLVNTCYNTFHYSSVSKLSLSSRIVL